MILGLYAFLLPLLLYVLWTTLALWDLGRRAETTATATWVWVFLILALPFLGALAYLFLSGTQRTSRIKLIALGGGAAYLLVLALGISIGGVS
jgi:lipopolysaccharide export LptBFGC system permease protein LptF